MVRRLSFWLFALLLSVSFVATGVDVAAAHAYLAESVPAEGSVVAEWPESVTLHFTEPVELRSSVFKVYPLEIEEGLDAARLDAAARALYEEVLPLRRDEDARVDAGVAQGASTTDTVKVLLKQDVTAGTYVAMWRVLSVDTHVVAGYYVFTYAP